MSVEEVKIGGKEEKVVNAALRNEEDDEMLPKDLWIYSISTNNAKLPVIKARTNQGQNRSKSTAFNASKN